jgi:high-affinity Fe2+/Pb2+ permease
LIIHFKDVSASFNALYVVIEKQMIFPYLRLAWSGRLPAYMKKIYSTMKGINNESLDRKSGKGKGKAIPATGREGP